MPITVPAIDDRRYADLLDEAVRRIAVHTPEWTNYNRSDPGVTLIELFAFLTETLLYRANQIPERNRRAFLSLLGVPLRPAQPARGLITVTNQRGPLRTVTLAHDLEVRAGQTPFRSETGLDVLPVEGRVYYKRPVVLTDEMQRRYEQLYASFLIADQPGEPPAGLRPYETAVLDGTQPDGVDLVSGTVDGALWLALLARDRETPEAVRPQIAGRTLSLGVVPRITDTAVTLPPAGTGAVGQAAATAGLQYAFPVVTPLPADHRERVATYAVREARDDVNVLLHPGVVQLVLPDMAGLATWTGLDPLEEGADAFPPAIDDPEVGARLVTWLRIGTSGVRQARILWAGINAVGVTQRARVLGEVLPVGTGQPDQRIQLAHAPVLPGSVGLTVTGAGGVPAAELWAEIADLMSAGPEVPVTDPRLPPGAAEPPPKPSAVYTLDPEAGVLRFGDGLRGRRPPPDADLRADYDYGLGRAGNVGPGSVTGGPALPPGFVATNPVRTWGGADAETAAEGEKQVARYLQHRDRLVTADDFRTIAGRTPGVEIARVEVLAAYDPQLAPNLPGGAPGAVTLMIVPRFDPAAPDAPSPDRFVLDAVCGYLDPRRLVTTELFLRGPDYVPVWISVGVDVMPGLSVAEVQARVAAELRRVLSPLPIEHQPVTDVGAGLPAYPHMGTGWPLRTAVSVAELSAYATRVDGVRVVNGVLLAAGGDAAVDPVVLTGLQMPRVAGIAVTQGDPAPLAALRGATPATGPGRTVPVPVVPQGC